ncbi:MAG: 4'-phosphopantetheinyl transferase, partial [Bacteroidota bacterium]
MPLFQHFNINEYTEIGLWRIDEDSEFFVSHLDLYEEEVALLEKIKGRRKLEWLSSRHLLHFMSGREERGACLKDEFGKPYLEGSTHK